MKRASVLSGLAVRQMRAPTVAWREMVKRGQRNNARLGLAAMQNKRAGTVPKACTTSKSVSGLCMSSEEDKKGGRKRREGE